jgi:hypothetical protein
MSETEESPKNTPAPPTAGALSHEQIANRAYFIWVSEGYPEGHDTDHWHQAEDQLRTEYSIVTDRSHETND